jgi:hypothetical protein
MEKCKTKLVPKMVKEMEANQIKGATKGLKEQTAKLKLDKENKSLQFGVAFNTAMARPYTKTMKNKLTKSYTNAFCNPECLGTLFQEDIDFDKFVDDLNLKKLSDKQKKIMVNFYKTMRKNMIKGRKKILGDDSFYHAFDKKTKKKLIKDGALSGCALGLFKFKV